MGNTKPADLFSQGEKFKRPFLGIVNDAIGQIPTGVSPARHFREAIRFVPGDAEAHYGLGCALAGQRKLEEAAQACREALRLRPGYADAAQALEKVERVNPLR